MDIDALDWQKYVTCVKESCCGVMVMAMAIMVMVMVILNNDGHSDEMNGDHIVFVVMAIVAMVMVIVMGW